MVCKEMCGFVYIFLLSLFLRADSRAMRQTARTACKKATISEPRQMDPKEVVIALTKALLVACLRSVWNHHAATTRSSTKEDR